MQQPMRKSLSFTINVKIAEAYSQVKLKSNELFVLYTRTCTRGFIKGRAPGKLTSCERDLAINLPGCFRLLFLLSFIRKTKNARLKNPTDLLLKNLMKPLNCTHLGQLFRITRVPWNQLCQSLETIVNGGLTKCCEKVIRKILKQTRPYM